jgi:hypothetical protein
MRRFPGGGEAPTTEADALGVVPDLARDLSQRVRAAVERARVRRAERDASTSSRSREAVPAARKGRRAVPRAHCLPLGGAPCRAIVPPVFARLARQKGRALSCGTGARPTGRRGIEVTRASRGRGGFEDMHAMHRSTRSKSLTRASRATAVSTTSRSNSEAPRGTRNVARLDLGGVARVASAGASCLY